MCPKTSLVDLRIVLKDFPISPNGKDTS